FLAVTPAQVFTMLDDGDEEALLRNTEHIIIGGGAVDAGLAERLESFPRHVWSTYGMTETLSHIALRRLNGPQRSAFYTPFPGVSLSLSPESTLVISAPAVAEGPVATNDIAELREDGSFRILGRKDNVINSGGIKIQIEAVEEQLRPFLPFAFCITAAPDEHYGEIVVMLAACGSDKTEREALERGIAVLHAYSRPKRVIAVPDLPRTGSGKIDRAGARAIANKLAGGSDA
ncbi:MAG: O-succinylbenzoic acid--CoA ligase, partial [Mailhella sp.]|nr:O-succinylbenzoic acid--CoA ligase [Mailhella sp.]